MTMSTELILSRVAAALVCEGCNGSGKRGRGQCRACDGRGEADHLKSPRVRFNNGFHDACSDVREGRNVKAINGHFDDFYAEGYIHGVLHATKGLDCTRSSAAWTEFSGLDDDSKSVSR